MTLLIKHGCLPCMRIKEVIEVAGRMDIEVIIKNITVKQKWEE